MSTTKHSQTFPQTCRIFRENEFWFRLEPPAFGAAGQLQCMPTRWYATREEAEAEARRMRWDIVAD